MTALAFTDSPIIANGAFFDVNAGTTTPTLLSIGQASGIVVASVRNPDIITVPITTYTLYRAAAATGPWVQIEQRAASPLSRWTNLFDAPGNAVGGPAYGARAYYTVTIDGPLQSNALAFIANANPVPIAAGGTLSAGAFGAYPLLGSDVYLDPSTGEAVIGVNGDLLTVNGLECLAQDLRTRITTEQGELLLHSTFGLTRERLIGSGQNAPAVQAQALQARFVDALLGDPRVSSIASLSISRVAWDAWTISVVLVAIGVEDPQRLNLVFPFYSE
jgi:hypothetical protein